MSQSYTSESIHQEIRLIYFVINRLQTFPSPGDYTHQHSSSQTCCCCCCCCLASLCTAGPPPQPRHPQLHPAEPGPDLRLQPRKQLCCPPDSRVCQHPVKPADSAAERHGFHQACVPCAHPAVCVRATSGPDQSTTGKKKKKKNTTQPVSCHL